MAVLLENPNIITFYNFPQKAEPGVGDSTNSEMESWIPWEEADCSFLLSN
jgi:hypothetical protein